jgi:outer membrane protein TolC
MTNMFRWALPVTALLSACIAAAQEDSLTLQECLRRAQENNLQLQQSREGINAAAAKLREAEAPLYPSVSASGSYSHMFPVSTFSFSMGPFSPPVSMRFGLENAYNASLGLQYMLFDWGRKGAGVDLGTLGKAAAEVGAELSELQVENAVVQVFYGILVTERAVVVLERSIASLEQRLTATRQRYNNGLVSRFDVLSLDVSLSAARTRRLDALSQLNRMRIAINRLLGLPLDRAVALRGELAYEPQSMRIDSLLVIARRTRPELLMAQTQEEMARKQIALASTFDKPTVSLSAGAGLRNGFFPNPDVLRGNWNAGMTVAFPIFDGFRTSALVQQAETALRTAELRTRDLGPAVELEIRQALIDLATNQERMALEQMRTGQAEEALRIAAERHAGGLISTLELIDAEVGLQNARLGHLQALGNCIQSRYALDKAIGRHPQ